MKTNLKYDIETDLLVVHNHLRTLLKKYNVDIRDSIDLERRLSDLKLKVDKL